MCKMQECDDLLDHVKKIKELTDQLVCLNVSVKNGNIVMTLLDNLPASYEYLITVFGDVADERANDGFHDGVFDVRHVQVQEEEASR